MRRIAALGLALMTGIATLAGCSDEATYCTEAAKAAPVVAEIAAGDVTKLNADETKLLLDELKKLQELAPADVQDDWKTLNDFTAKVFAAKNDSKQLAALRAERPSVSQAEDAIRKNAGDACSVSLN
jgi:hypothetical protein